MASVWLRARRAPGSALPSDDRDPDEVIKWLEEWVLPSRDTWVMVHNDAVVAFVVVVPEWIDHFFVDPDHEGRGLGARLLEHAKELQPGGLEVWTLETNRRARHVYERHGFVRVGAFHGANKEGVAEIRYHWPGRNA